MKLSSSGTPPSEAPHRDPGATEQFPGQWPDQVQMPDPSGDLSVGLPGQPVNATPAQPPRRRRSGPRSWIGMLVIAGSVSAGLAQGGSQRLQYLLGVAFGLVLFSITAIALFVRKARSQRNATMSYGDAPEPPAPTYRVWIIGSAAVGAIGVVGIIVCLALLGYASGSQPNYNNPSVVAASIKALTQQRLSDQSGQYYEPGVTVTEVVCAPSGTSTDHCVVTLSNGQIVTTTAVILENGTAYRTQ
jgi:hypothetical protein